ncbi:MAG: S-methyl-5'-thioadenosine phosphorylase [Candidatus Marinimicrobia bacterium]|nr:S-methyl-5'-thioadenosine phosphorylase [Candidatus Neomarinimicrobiota bacterium]
MKIGIIGGTGLYKFTIGNDSENVFIDTPFGEHSKPIIKSKYGKHELFFLPRHGEGHHFLPTTINYRANIWALKSLGVNTVISVSSVGSLQENIHPKDVVVIDQFFDRTKHRVDSFFQNGLVGHIPFAYPICKNLADELYRAGKNITKNIHNTGTYVNIEGPQFSTLAESNFYRKMDFDVVGMTNITEAKLAREAQMHYATLAMVTDYDCWKEDEIVTIEKILENLSYNSESAMKIIKEFLNIFEMEEDCGCRTVLDNAILSNGKGLDNKLKEKYNILFK